MCASARRRRRHRRSRKRGCRTKSNGRPSRPSTAIRTCARCGRSSTPVSIPTAFVRPDGDIIMKGGLGNLMKQAQAMQDNLRKAQEELASMEVTGNAGGGIVSVVMTCRYDVRRVTVDPSLLKDDK